MARSTNTFLVFGTVLLMSSAWMLSAQPGASRSSKSSSPAATNSGAKKATSSPGAVGGSSSAAGNTSQYEVLTNALQAAKSTVVPGADSIAAQVANDPAKAALTAVGLAMIVAGPSGLGVLTEGESLLMGTGLNLITAVLYPPNRADINQSIFNFVLTPFDRAKDVVGGIASVQSLTSGESKPQENQFYLTTPAYLPLLDASFYKRAHDDFVQQSRTPSPALQELRNADVPTQDLNGRLEELKKQIAQTDSDLNAAQRVFQLRQSGAPTLSSPRNYICQSGFCTLEEWEQESGISSPKDQKTSGPCGGSGGGLAAILEALICKIGDELSSVDEIGSAPGQAITRPSGVTPALDAKLQQLRQQAEEADRELSQAQRQLIKAKQ